MNVTHYEFLTLLSTKDWNAWRTESQDCPDLRNADLCLRNIDLRNIDLNRADLEDAGLGWADLRRANLNKANLRDAKLFMANLRFADLRGANLRGADLRWADLRTADLNGADLWNADLRGAKGIVYSFFDPRDNVLVGWLKNTKSWFNTNGLSFCEKDALEYWGSASYPDQKRGQEYVEAVKFLAGIIKSWGDKRV